MRLGDLRFNLDLHNYATQLNSTQSKVECVVRLLTFALSDVILDWMQRQRRRRR